MSTTIKRKTAHIKRVTKSHKPVGTAKRKVDAQGLTASERALAEPITGDGEPEAVRPEAADAFLQMLSGLETARASKGDGEEDMDDHEVDDFGDDADDNLDDPYENSDEAIPAKAARAGR
jgi:hypothetical protein